MPTPKTVTKINKDGVTFTSDVDKCNYLMYELARGALRDTAKFVRKEFESRYYSHFKKHTGKGGKSPTAKVFSNKNTLYPRVDIGLPHSNKKNTAQGFYGFFQEFGSSKTPKLAFLQKSVEENVSRIVEIQSKYLSALEDEANALSVVNEIGEEEIDIDE